MFSVLAQALYDGLKEAILGNVSLEYLDVVSAIVVVIVFYPMWLSLKRSGRKH
jgi:hypothetical protein